MKKPLLKHLFLSLSLSLILFLFLKCAFLDDMAFYVLRNIFVGGGLNVIDYDVIVETFISTFNTITIFSMLFLALASFIVHVILLDIDKKKKIPLFVLAGILYILYVLLKIELVYSCFSHFFSTLILSMFDYGTQLYSITSSILSNMIYIFTKTIKTAIAVIALLLVIKYNNVVSYSNKTKKIIVLLSTIALISYILVNISTCCLVVYIHLSVYFDLPNIYTLAQSFGLSTLVTYTIIDNLLFRFSYILPFVLIIVILVISIATCFKSRKNSLEEGKKKRSFIVLLPLIVVLVLFISDFFAVYPWWLLLIIKTF